MKACLQQVVQKWGKYENNSSVDGSGVYGGRCPYGLCLADGRDFTGGGADSFIAPAVQPFLGEECEADGRRLGKLRKFSVPVSGAPAR